MPSVLCTFVSKLYVWNSSTYRNASTCEAMVIKRNWVMAKARPCPVASRIRLASLERDAKLKAIEKELEVGSINIYVCL